jgi:hypothetical protein
MPRRAPSSGCKLARLDPRFFHPALNFKPKLMLPEFPSLFGEVPSLMVLKAGCKSLCVPGLDPGGLFLAPFLQTAQPEWTDGNALVVEPIEIVLKSGRWKILLSFGAAGANAKERAAQTEKQDEGKKSQTRSPYPIAIHSRPLFSPLSAPLEEAVLN